MPLRAGSRARRRGESKHVRWQAAAVRGLTALPERRQARHICRVTKIKILTRPAASLFHPLGEGHRPGNGWSRFVRILCPDQKTIQPHTKPDTYEHSQTGGSA